MTRELKNRGPDGEGFYQDDDVSFSHKRLAIIDLNLRSNQPFVDKKKETLSKAGKLVERGSDSIAKARNRFSKTGKEDL